MFRCRVALALGMPPSEVNELPSRDLDLLSLYWCAEPWGAYRDNLHAALIAMQVTRPNMKPGAKLSLDDFMFRSPEEVADVQTSKRKRATSNVFSMLKMLATRGRNG